MDITLEQIETKVFSILQSYCEDNQIEATIDKTTPLIGSQRLLDSMGLVNIIIDIETAFLDDEINISLTSEAAMSLRVSPFRSVQSLCNYIYTQIEHE